MPLPVRGEVGDDSVKLVEHRARRFDPPVVTVSVEATPPELAW